MWGSRIRQRGLGAVAFRSAGRVLTFIAPAETSGHRNALVQTRPVFVKRNGKRLCQRYTKVESRMMTTGRTGPPSNGWTFMGAVHL
jgi:hypothetical protein